MLHIRSSLIENKRQKQAHSEALTRQEDRKKRNVDNTKYLKKSESELVD